MKNRVFRFKPTEEKQHHLVGLLRHVSGDSLDNQTISDVLYIVPTHRQYTVSGFGDKQSFQDAVMRAKINETLLSYVRPQDDHGTIIAVISPKTRAKSKKSHRAILMYVPHLCTEKGAAT